MESQKKNILIVDDEPHISSLIKLSLDSDFFNIKTVFGPSELMSALETDRVDLITMDLMMPGTDGISLIKEIQAKVKYKDIPIVIISAKNSIKDKIEGVNEGAIDFIEKPFDPEKLNERVKDIFMP